MSNPTDTPHRGPGRPPKARVAPDITVSNRQAEPQEELYAGDLDQAEKLIERRLERGIFDYTTGRIQFKNPTLLGRWFNEGVNSQQIYRARQKGWLPARPDMIVDLDQLGLYSLNPAGEIVRGQRGEEHLMFMTKANYERVMAAKTNANLKRMGSTSRVKEDLADTAGQQLGPEAADWVHRHVVGEVIDSYERVEKIGDEKDQGT